MNLSKDIVEVGLVAGAITTIVAAITKPWNYFKKRQMLKKQMMLFTFKLGMVSPDLPISENIRAGELYMAAGGNGHMKEVHERNCKQVREGAKK